MKRYIDAEKLYKKVDELMAHYAKSEVEMEDDTELSIFYQGKRKMSSEVINLITSLQQEQPMPDSTKLIELWNKDKEMLKEKDFRDDAWRLAYNAFMCGFGRGVSVKRQEQPEVDLEKEIDLSIRLMPGVHSLEDNKQWYKGRCENIKELARHFYNLALADVREMVARQQKANHNGTDEWIRAKAIAYESICDFIDNLTK